MILIIKSYSLALEGYHQVYLSQSRENTEGHRNAAGSLVRLADEIDKKKGEGWYFEIAEEMRILAKNIIDGKTPG